MGAQISSISLRTPPSSSYPVSSLLLPRAKQHYQVGLVRTSAHTFAANFSPSPSLVSPSLSLSSTPPPSMSSLSSSPPTLLPSLPCSSVSSLVVSSYTIAPPPVAFVTEKQVAFVLTKKEEEKEKKLEQECIEDDDELWLEIRKEAKSKAVEEPVLASYFSSTVLSHRLLECVLAFHLSNKLSNTTLLSTQLYTLFVDILMEDAGIRTAMRADIRAVRRRDPACTSYCDALLNLKGFLACQTHRIAHHLWVQGRTSLALALQSRVSEVFAVDIHPAAIVGRGVLLDHATGLVVGETATIGNNVSILHHVTLGGTGKYGGDRHPKIGDGVLIGAGATILGNVVIGEGAKIGAGSVVLTDIPPKTTAVGNPARLVGGKKAPKQLRETPSQTMDHTSFMSHWSDYVI